ncbi:MAG TPA: site-2 protease family protein [Mycobacteriales bacterium]|nr:site-2 protease family protein [Mycobacteriales bacterium]
MTAPAPAPPPRRATNVLHLGRILGIPIVVAPSWFVVALLGVYLFGPAVHAQLPQQTLGTAYLVTTACVLTLYGSVLLHELTHSVVARALGLPVRRIVLQLLGGLSEITGEAPTPGIEYLVAVSGPMTSLLLAGVGFATERNLPAHSVAWVLAWALARLNALVAVFNLLPGLPLDGGRVLRAGLWWGLKSKLSATRVSAYTGRGIAAAVAFFAVVSTFGPQGHGTLNFLYLLLLAMFLWQSAGQSLAQLRLSSVVPSLVARTLTRRALPVAADLPLAEAIRRAHETQSRALVVVDGRGVPDGIVPEASVTAVPVERRPWINVGSLSRHIAPELRIAADLSGQDLMAALQAAPASEYLVVEASGQVYGVLAQADVLAALRGPA